MDLLFHTIALEPARWIAQRTSQDLLTLLPRIAAAGFQRIEVFEPHLTSAVTSPEIRDAFQSSGIIPEILSSYVNLNPAVTTNDAVDEKIQEIRARIDYYGFRGIRIFPGPGMNPCDTAAIPGFVERLERLAATLPDTEILLETHDGSLADDPETIVRIVRELAAANVSLLYQPTLFEPEDALRQFALQKPYIRHIHLQNRHPDKSFAPLSEGVIPWRQIIAQLDKPVTATLEFVPAGICTVAQFDLSATLRQAQSEAAFIREL
jgi:sugar phosphate isomerase/epimerase